MTLRTRRMAVVLAIALAGIPVGAQTPDKAAEAAMLTVDRAFNQAVADRDAARFLSLVAEDADFESSDARGREAIGKAWAPYFEAGGPQVTWQPTRAVALAGGELGYTTGTWVRRRKGTDGAIVTTHGDYLTVWRKQMDGVWRAVFDTGSTAR